MTYDQRLPSGVAVDEANVRIEKLLSMQNMYDRLFTADCPLGFKCPLFACSSFLDFKVTHLHNHICPVAAQVTRVESDTAIMKFPR
jgi:hypothetical protein